MLRLRSRACLGLVLLLAARGPVGAQGAAARTVDARQLLGIAKGALTAAAQAAQAANTPLNPGQARNRPFWNAIDAMGRSLDAVEAAFVAKAPSFFDTLGAGSRALAELKAVWSHAGVDDPGA